MYGGEWIRRGSHLNEPGKENVYVAKDVKIDENNDYLTDNLSERKQLLEENGFSNGFSNVNEDYKEITPLYEYFIPWNIHYTHNQYGIGHIRYDKYIKVKNKSFIISYRYGVVMDG